MSVLTKTSSLPYDQESVPILEQPRALYTLFFAELWERFSFYGMRALLVLFMTKELLLTNHASLGILGVYGALLYCSNILGGYLADGFLGNRRAVMLGSIFIILGHLLLTIPMTTFLKHDSFYYGLAFLIVGTGFFKPNVSSFLGQFYHANDPRRDSGFTLFFMGINIGGFLAPLVCGTIGEIYGWHYGFGVAALGMLLGAFVFYGGKAHFGDIGSPPLQKPSKNFWGGMSALHFILLGIALFMPLMVYVLKSHDHLGEYLTLAGAAVFILIAWIAFRSPAEECKMIFTLLVMFFFVVSFFSIWEQVGGSLLLFTQHNIDRTVFGMTLPVSWSQSFSPLCIILLSPLVSYLWTFLNRHNLDPLTPLKFALGFFSAALGFYLFVIGIHHHTNGLVDIGWLLGGIALFTLGEIFISPVGLSMVTRLAPARFASLLMGTFFFAIGLASYLAQAFVRFFGIPENSLSGDMTTSLMSTLGGYETIFTFIALFALVSGFCALIVTPFVYGVFKRHA